MCGPASNTGGWSTRMVLLNDREHPVVGPHFSKKLVSGNFQVSFSMMALIFLYWLVWKACWYTCIDEWGRGAWGPAVPHKTKHYTQTYWGISPPSVLLNNLVTWSWVTSFSCFQALSHFSVLFYKVLIRSLLLCI